MGLKSTASGKGIVGKFTGQPLNAVSVNFSRGSPPPPPSLDFSDSANSMYIPLLFGYQIL